MESFHSSSFYQSSSATPSRRYAHTPTSQRLRSQPVPQRQLVQSRLDYQPGMLLHDLPLDDNDHSMADEHELNEEPTTYGEVTALLQQQQKMLTELLQKQEVVQQKQLVFENKINEVEPKIKSSPSSTDSSPASNKRRRLVTGVLSVSKHNNILYTLYDITTQ